MDIAAAAAASSNIAFLTALGMIVDPTTDRPGEHFDSFRVRAVSAPALVEAVEALGVKLARKLPGLTVTTYVDPYESAEAQIWCAAHRSWANSKGTCLALADTFASQVDLAASLRGGCYQAPAEAVTVEIRVEGLPTWGDWSVAGVLTRDQNDVVIATTVGSARGSDEAFAIRHAHLAGECSHCNKSRARSVTILLANDATGEIRPVGKSCLAQYTGSMIRTEALAVLTSLAERFAREVGGILTREEHSAPTVDVVALAMRYIALDGRFIRSGEFGKDIQPTAHSVREALLWAGESIRRPRVLADELTDADRAAARRAIDAVLAEESNSPYVLNLQSAASSDWTQITGKLNRVGLLASLPGSAERALEFAARKAEREAEKAAADAAAPARVNAHVGAEKQRREFTGVVFSAKVVEIEGYGWNSGTEYKDMIIIDTAEGTLKLFGTVGYPAGHDIETLTGKTVTLVGTIAERGHGEFQGHCQTKLNRTKILTVS